MSSNIVNVKIQEAYDTEANWSTNNPVLLEGQIAISSDKNGMYKVGDGTSTWSALSYNTANTANSATSATTAQKLGSSNVGASTTPIYLASGTATACSGVTVPGIKTASEVTTLGYGTNNAYVANIAMLAYWNGAYVNTSSNLRYCDRGRFGTIVTKGTGDYLPISGGTLTGGLSITKTLAVASTITCSDVITAENRIDATRIYPKGTYSTTTSGAANVAITSGYYLVRSTASSKRYKHDINPITGYKAILDIPVKEYIYNLDYLSEEDQRYNTVIPGFIAEDVYEHYPIAAEIVDGEVDDWNIRMIVPPMLKLIQDNYNTIQEQNELIQNLIKRVEELEAK